MKIFFKIKFSYHIPVIQWFPHLNDILVYVCVACACTNEDQRTTWSSWIFPSATWFSGIELISLGLAQVISPAEPTCQPWLILLLQILFSFNNRIFWKTNTRHNLILLSKRLKKWKKRGKESGEQHAYPGLWLINSKAICRDQICLVIIKIVLGVGMFLGSHGQ